jgi:hypothetical protein
MDLLSLKRPDLAPIGASPASSVKPAAERRLQSLADVLD